MTHSIPVSMDAGSGRRAAPTPHSIARRRRRSWRAPAGRADTPDLAFCSRSGPPSVPWLEPDVNDRLTELAAAGASGVAVVPIGFVSDHMEVRFDLDTEAAHTAAAAGLPFVRVATPGTHPRFVGAVVDRLVDVAAAGRGMVCPAGCCPNPRGHRPAVCGSD